MSHVHPEPRERRDPRAPKNPGTTGERREHRHGVGQNDPAHQLLHLPLEENDANAATVGEYLGLLLSTLWLQQDGFSGKRPFGNSDWATPVYLAMGKAGMIYFALNEDGYIDEFSTEEEQMIADELILQAIRFTYYHE